MPALDAWSALASLFAWAFLSASVMPVPSEIAMLALMVGEAAPVWVIVAVASLGNTLGASVNWLLGRGLARLRHRRWFPVSEAQLQRAERRYHRWGRWSLLLSPIPVLGDPLTVLAGALREPLLTFLLIVGLAKTARYVAVATLATT